MSVWRDSSTGNIADPDLRVKIEYDDGTLDNFQIGVNQGQFPGR